MKRVLIGLFGCFLAVILLGCRPTATASPTSLPSTPTATSLPANTPTSPSLPTEAPPTLEPTAESQPDPGEGQDSQEFIFSEYDLLAVYYDPQEWVSDKGMGMGFLESTTISGCEITDQGATEPPAEGDTLSLDGVEFFRAITENPTSGDVTGWYLLNDPIPPDYENDFITPFFVVSAPEDNSGACLEAAEGVLGTLHDSPK